MRRMDGVSAFLFHQEQVRCRDAHPENFDHGYSDIPGGWNYELFRKSVPTGGTCCRCSLESAEGSSWACTTRYGWTTRTSTWITTCAVSPARPGTASVL